MDQTLFPRAIADLVERYHDQRDSYKSTAYKEAQLREEFINPFWWELGWDMTNRAGLAEAYKEVIHEDSLRIEGAIKAPDYTFRVGSEKKFFLEVKAPKVNVAKEVAPAYQLKRYSWSAGLAVSLLSDFEEFAVYQTTSVPKPNDAPFKDRIELFSFEQYEEKWPWLVETFSRDAVWKGRFDKYAAQAKGKRGTTPFDKQFLADMVAWRKKLAENIALRNKGLTEAELNHAVQLTLDRIIMLRICEDRKIEQYGNLAVDAGLNYVLALNSPSFLRRGTGGGPGVYENLLNRFKMADDRFNSGLFHFRKEKDRNEFDSLTPRLTIDDKVLTEIIKNLYYPESPYAFDIVPSDILGHVYEQFLGQVITLTKGGYARVEEKPEVKKAHGVYYTPTYIVDYIVKNTVGKILEETKAKVPTLKILDPACGSGTFLLGAYQYLLDWYLKFYLENDPEAWAKKKVLDKIPTNIPLTASFSSVPKDSPSFSRRGTGGGRGDDEASANPTQPPPNPRLEKAGGLYKLDYRLSQKERKRILLDHIHGVDIDSNAVEVAKLNLMLKVLEGGTSADGTQRIAYDTSERLLPDLDKNIICGNSLIGTDYYTQNPLLFKEGQASATMRGGGPETDKINAMDWPHAFPDIMKRGGFDVVIGNPPWIDIKGMDPDQVDYFFKRFDTTENRMNVFATFVHRSFDLLRNGGLFGMITPSSYLTQSSYQKLRRKLLNNSIRKIVRTPDNAFEGVIAETAILIAAKDGGHQHTEILILPRQAKLDAITVATAERTGKIEQGIWKAEPNLIFNIHLDNEKRSIIAKMQKGTERLDAICDFSLGLTPYDKYKGQSPKLIQERGYHASKKLSAEYKPILEGSDITRYSVEWGGKEWIKYGPWLGAPREQRFFKGPRILVRQIISGNPLRIYAGYTAKELYNAQVAFNLLLKKEKSELGIPFLLAILNSWLMSWYHRQVYLDPGKNTFQKILIQDARQFPIPIVDVGNAKALALHNSIVASANKMIELKERIRNGRVQNRTQLDRQIAGVDREIDQLVYQLYGLTAEEIKVVEGE